MVKAERQALNRSGGCDSQYTGARGTAPSDQRDGSSLFSNGGKESCSKSVFLGYSSGVLMAPLLATSGACSQALGGVVPAFELNVIRFATQLLLVVVPVVLFKRPAFPTDRKNRIVFVINGFLPSFSNLLYYEATIYIPLGAVVGMETTCLIVLAALVAVILRERLDPATLVSVALATVGILCLTQPTFLFKFFGRVSDTYTTPVCVHPVKSGSQLVNRTLPWDVEGLWNTTSIPTPQPNKTASTGRLKIQNEAKGYLLVVVATLCTSANIHTYHHFLRDTDKFAMLLCYCILGTVSSLIAMSATETPTFPRTPQCVGLLVGHATSTAIATSLLIVPAILVPPVTFSLLYSLKLVFVLVAQYTVLRYINPGHRNYVEIAGGILVFSANALRPVFTLYQQWRDKPRQS